jgi:hypothetical protein
VSRNQNHPALKNDGSGGSGAGSVNVVYGTLSNLSIGEWDCEVKLLGEIISVFSAQAKLPLHRLPEKRGG